MIVMVFLGGRLSDRWGSRWPAVVGLSIQGLTALSFFLLPESAPIWSVVAILVFYGLGNGFALAALHHAALVGVPEAKIGQASGLYSTLRFFGSVVGSALAGVILAFLLDQHMPLLRAYQYAFLVFAGSALAGACVGLQLRENRSDVVLRPARERG
jgi:DHA2 family methylenomycin A resistance protein-like MFS transporter